MRHKTLGAISPTRRRSGVAPAFLSYSQSLGEGGGKGAPGLHNERMDSTVTVSQKRLFDVLLNVALVRPVFIWGPPGIGKSSIVQQFAASLGLPCVSLLGSQLAPEDLIGVPQIVEGVSRFCPPSSIARAEPYCLFLDELNACSHEVQKAF